MSNTFFQGEQPQILSTFTTTFWCEACMQTRVVLVSKLHSDILHVVDYIMDTAHPGKNSYSSYLVRIGETPLEEQYLMDSIDEGHVKNVHPELFAELLDPASLFDWKESME